MPDKYTEDFIKDLEEAYDEQRRIRRFFTRQPPKRRSALLVQPNLGGGASVSIALAAGQGSRVNAGPVNFTVTFSEAATGFTNADVITSASTVGGTLAVAVTGTGPAYNVAVSGMTGNGSVTISIPAAAATTTAKGLPFPASNTATVVFDTARPSVTVAAAAGQSDPAAIAPITFTVTFSEPVTGFLATDVVITGTAGGTKVVSLNGNNAEVTGMTTGGTVIATVPVNAVTDLAGNLSTVSNSATVQWTPDATRPTVTIAHSGADPSSDSPQFFPVAFSEVVTGFGPATGSLDISFAGSTVGGTLSANVSTGTGDTYLVSVTGMAAPTGTLAVTVIDGAAVDASGNTSQVSNTATTTWNFVPVDTTRPTVTIVQGGSQADPTTDTPIFFSVTFSEVVTGFGPATNSPDISFTGSGVGGTLTADVSAGTGDTYLVSVSGMAAPSGTVVVNIIDGAAQDAAGNLSLPSAGGDNVVTWNAAPPVTDGQMDFSNPDQSGLIAILDDF